MVGRPSLKSSAQEKHLGLLQLIVALPLLYTCFGSTLPAAVRFRRQVLVPKVNFNPQNCYRRVQTCCYRYVRCGKRCSTQYCRQKPSCILYKFGHCHRWRTVRVCERKCYHVTCPKFECTPINLDTPATYTPPTILTRVTTLHGTPLPSSGAAPTTISPSSSPRPSSTRSATPSRSPVISKTPTQSPLHSKTPSPSPSHSKAPSPSPSHSKAPSPSPSHSKAPSPSPSHSKAPSLSPSRSPIVLPSRSPTPSRSSTPTASLFFPSPSKKLCPRLWRYRPLQILPPARPLLCRPLPYLLRPIMQYPCLFKPPTFSNRLSPSRIPPPSKRPKLRPLIQQLFPIFPLPKQACSQAFYSTSNFPILPFPL